MLLKNNSQNIAICIDLLIIYMYRSFNTKLFQEKLQRDNEGWSQALRSISALIELSKMTKSQQNLVQMTKSSSSTIVEQKFELVMNDDNFGHFVEREEFVDVAIQHPLPAAPFPSRSTLAIRSHSIYSRAIRFLSITSVGNFPLVEMH